MFDDLEDFLPRLFIWTVIIGLAVLLTFGICVYRISPGEVGVVVNMFGSEKGVEENEIKVGYHFLAPWKSVYRFPIFEQNHQWTGHDGFSFQTLEGLSVSSDIGITFHLMPDRIHELFCKYRRGMDEITHLFIRNNIRDAINKVSAKLKIEDLLGPKKEEFFSEVQSQLHDELEPLGFEIEHIYIIGELNVPESVKQALNRKIEAIQRAQQRENELREAEAEARKQVAEAEGAARSQIVKAKAEAENQIVRAKVDAEVITLRASSEAKANDVISHSITKDLLEWNAINKWDGKLPEALAGSEMPFLYSIGRK